MKGLVEAYRALSDVYLKKSWISEAIKRQGPALLSEKGSYRLVYGVVEHDRLYEYRIARFAEKAPKPAIKILLKMGMYLLDDSDLPPYAAVNAVAETAKAVGKGGVCGFLNALLRRYSLEGKDCNPTDEEELISLRSNLPLWLVRRYRAELGKEQADRRLTAPRTSRTHIRPALSFGKNALVSLLKERGASYEETQYGFYIGEVGVISDLLKEGKATVMSWGSMDICSAVERPTGKILDLCAAPGGKCVLLAERFGTEIVACDLYPHRVELIEKYAARMKVKGIECQTQDGRLLRAEWKDAFSVVLLDAPCSGLGSLASNPDVALNRTEKDLDAIVNTQKKLLATAGEYVQKGGMLLYATCSDLPSEDSFVVRDFLQKNDGFFLEKEKYTDPEEGGGESYYYAVLRKR